MYFERLNYGAVILVFGLLSLGRGLLDVFCSNAVAESNRRRNKAVREGRLGGPPATFGEMRRPHAESPSDVRAKGKNVLWFGGALCVIGITLMLLLD